MEATPAKAARVSLGRDFWLFQAGQGISLVGDACGTLALAWWILESTGLAGHVAWVFGPSALVQCLLTPLLGPLGDRHSRKTLIILSDALRAAVLGALATVAISGSYSQPVVLALFIAFGAGSALFTSASLSIVPQLVRPDAVADAIRISQTIQALGRVAGGVIAGLMVAFVGVASAFAADAISFGIAVVATAAITVRIVARSGDPASPGAVLTTSFLSELEAGFRVIFGVRVLAWLCLGIAVFNVLLSPMTIVLPTFVKEAREMPAWFLGMLEAGFGVGMILGALTLGFVERRLSLITTVATGLVLLGAATVALAFVPGVALPVVMELLGGMGVMWSNIPIAVRISLATPDHFRARINSVVGFIFAASAPVGVGLAGLLLPRLGAPATLAVLGALVVATVPLLNRIPGFRPLFLGASDHMDGYFLRQYPEAFEQAPRTLPLP